MRRERLLMARLYLGLARIYHESFRLHEPFGADADRLLVAVAVLIGHLENKPMTASSLSRYLDMPRTTVVRKLESLTRAGVIEETTGHRYCVPRTRVMVVDGPMRALRMITETGRQIGLIAG